MANTWTYAYESKFGSQGSGNGQFQDPHDIGFLSNGDFFLCDRVRNDIQRFTSTGTYISKFGSSGSADGQFNVPYAISVDASDNLWVCDRGNDRIQKFNSAGVFQTKITSINGKSLDAPEDMFFDPVNGDIYICDTGNNRVCKLDSSLAFIREWGERGNGNGMFDHNHSLVVDAQRNVFVSCGNQPYIQKFDKDGKFIKKFGSEGTGPGQVQMFLEHMDIDVFQHLHLVNNDSRPIINIWDTDGNWITQYGNVKSGSADGQFKEPEHVVCQPGTGKPYIVDAKNFRVQIFSVTTTAVTPPTPTPREQSGQIGMFLTGGSSNTDPNVSYGGNVSSTEVVSGNLHALFRRVTDSEASSGVTIFRCVAIKNKDANATMRNVVFYMVADTRSPDDLSLYSNCQADKNTAETAIANEFTFPTGSKIDFKAALSRSGGIKLPDLLPGEYQCIWLRISVNPGAQQFTENFFKVRCEVNSTGASEPPVPPAPDPETGVNFSMATVGDTGSGKTFTGIINKMKARGVGHIFFNGDLAYSSSMKNWLNATSSVRSISKVSFGNHDVDDGDGNSQTINDLKNAYDIPATFYSYIFRNVGIVVMESGEHHSVPENATSNQYAFVKSALEGFKANAAIEWIFVFNHYPIYTVSSNHPAETDTRGWYEPLFDANGVDVVFAGHNHIMSSSKLIKFDTVVSGTDPDYAYSRATPNHGKLYLIAGAGGKSHYNSGSANSTFPFVDDSHYGYLFMEFSNTAKKITFKFYDSSDNLLKQLTLTHT